MFFKNFTMACAAAALMAVPASRATADSGDFAAGIVAGVIGSAVVRNAQPRRTVRRSTTRTVRQTAPRPSISSAQRAENREVQTSLNYFGFPAGSPDGVFGRRTRAAVSGYQVHMGYPATGQLTQYEKDFLLQSYHRAISGGAATTQAIAANPQGPRGLLTTYRNQAAGIVTATAPTQAPAVALAPSATTTVVALQPQVLPLQQEGTTTTTTTTVSAADGSTTTAPALPNFLGTTEAVSLASHCNQVSLITSTNGGFTTEANLVDASFALNEQFCLARTYAIAEGEELLTKISGFSKEQIETQCGQLGAAMKAEITSLSLKPNVEVMAEVSGFVQKNNVSPAQMLGTAKVCLSVGYRTDNMDVAVGSSLLLVALGAHPYAELLGHHLNNGFGATQRPDLAVAWYGHAIEALEAGAPAVFAPGQPERTGLLRKAAMMSGDTTQGAAALPAFTVQQ